MAVNFFSTSETKFGQRLRRMRLIELSALSVATKENVVTLSLVATQQHKSVHILVISQGTEKNLYILKHLPSCIAMSEKAILPFCPFNKVHYLSLEMSPLLLFSRGLERHRRGTRALAVTDEKFRN